MLMLVLLSMLAEFSSVYDLTFRIQKIWKQTKGQEMDFGTIMCWADNNVGQQKEPCVFHLIAAGKPEMPANCTVVNQTSDSLEVYCIEDLLTFGFLKKYEPKISFRILEYIVIPNPSASAALQGLQELKVYLGSIK
uniref:Uncharacterized protein n=1 Tax=Glossina brevipalpis TaxID=37001 RepID=A0A1A9WRF7_9MUSC